LEVERHAATVGPGVDERSGKIVVVATGREGVDHDPAVQVVVHKRLGGGVPGHAPRHVEARVVDRAHQPALAPLTYFARDPAPWIWAIARTIKST
jgi:hypothetical protein